jgi:5'-deoxynucleotidase YfbR-like HD superfamily hydrolase
MPLNKKYKGENPITFFKQLSPELRFIVETHHLANIYRAGWLEPRRNIPIEACESDFEHMSGMRVILRIVYAKYRDQFKGVDWMEASMMIDCHEYGEIRNKNGDMTPGDNISKKEKHELEEESVIGVLKDTPNGNYDKMLWDRFEAHACPTSRLVHEIDYLQMIIRARIYEKQFQKDLSEFYTPEKSAARLKSPVLIKLFNEILTK